MKSLDETQMVPSESRPYSRGGPIFRYLYGRWRQVLAFGDLLGTDGRPSATKLMAFSIQFTVLYVAVVRVHKNAAEAWSWQMFWTTLLCMAVMFGRWGYKGFMDLMKNKWSGGLGG